MCKWAWIIVSTVNAISLEETIRLLAVKLIKSLIRVGVPTVHAVAEVCADANSAHVRLHIIVVRFRCEGVALGREPLAPKVHR